MKTQTLLIFIISVLIPTAFLSYFGFKAVKSEEIIIEKAIRSRYEATADIVAGEIDQVLRKTSRKPAAGVTVDLTPLLLAPVNLFKGSVVLFDEEGRSLDTSVSQKMSDAVFLRPIKGFPYTLAVYENCPPVLLRKFEQSKKKLFGYVVIICLSAFFIITGAIFTLGSLAGEWRKAALKSEFLAHLSHDLRRPLTSIRMFSEMLQSGAVTNSDKRQEYYDIISSESERLTHLANNILDFSRVEARGKKLEFKSGDLSAVLTDSVERFNRYLSDGNNRAEFGGTDPVIVCMDANALSHAMINLLSNAAKYSSPGSGIRVNLARRANEAVVEVIDKGIGISKKDLKKIFEGYYRASRKEVTDTEGTGLGLALVQFIIKAHGGRVEVESVVGVGSTFRVLLPI